MRHAGAIAVDRAAPLFDEAPRDRFRQIYQLMLHIDNLVEPDPEQVLIARLSALPWLMRDLQLPSRIERIPLR
jgi:hypothetical protein